VRTPGSKKRQKAGDAKYCVLRDGTILRNKKSNLRSWKGNQGRTWREKINRRKESQSSAKKRNEKRAIQKKKSKKKS